MTTRPRDKKLQLRRKSLGLCISCGKNKATQFVKCLSCRKRAKENRQKLALDKSM